MFDFKFDWKEELNTGLDGVDAQHKEMFRIVRDMEQLLIIRCIGVSYEQLYDIVTQLREFVAYHFYTEEELMIRYKYSDVKEHVLMHREFESYVINIDVPKLGANPYDELKRIKDYTQDWIFEHMFNCDKHMGQEIFEKAKQDQI